MLIKRWTPWLGDSRARQIQGWLNTCPGGCSGGIVPASVWSPLPLEGWEPCPTQSEFYQWQYRWYASQFDRGCEVQGTAAETSGKDAVSAETNWLERLNCGEIGRSQVPRLITLSQATLSPPESPFLAHFHVWTSVVWLLYLQSMNLSGSRLTSPESQRYHQTASEANRKVSLILLWPFLLMYPPIYFKLS